MYDMCVFIVSSCQISVKNVTSMSLVLCISVVMKGGQTAHLVNYSIKLSMGSVICTFLRWQMMVINEASNGDVVLVFISPAVITDERYVKHAKRRPD